MDGSVSVFGRQFPYTSWHGEKLLGQLCFLQFYKPALQSEIFEEAPLLAIARTDKTVLFEFSNFPKFVCSHENLSFILPHSTSWFYLILDHFSGNATFVDNWWEVANGRLRDPLLLDQLLRLATADVKPEGRSLEEVFSEYMYEGEETAAPHTGTENFFQPTLEAALGRTIMGLVVYRKMVSVAINLMEHHAFSIYSYAFQHFGPLTETIQVRAAIALHRVTSNGLHIDCEGFLNYREKMRQEIRSCAVELTMLPECRGLFSSDLNGNLVVLENEQLQYRRNIAEILVHVITSVTDDAKLISHARNSSPGRKPEWKFWKKYSGLHPFLDAWSRLEHALMQYRATNQIHKSCQPSSFPSLLVLHYKYNPLSRRGRAVSEFQRTPHDLRPFFCARPGHLLLSIGM